MRFPDRPLDDESPESPVFFHFEDVEFELPDEQGLTAWLNSVAEAEGKTLLELNYIFCSDERLREINVEFLDHDYYTDIITFPYAEGSALHSDLFISSERVADNARAAGVAFEHELRRVMVHGLLHLAGYGDKTAEEQSVMRGKEDFYLRRSASL
jgi:probable rRNA maturation factor